MKVAVSVLIFAVCSIPSAVAQRVYWSASGSLHSAGLDGQNKTDLTGRLHSRPLAIATDGKDWVYWSDEDRCIHRMTYDGQGRETIHMSARDVVSLAVDSMHRQVYWLERQALEYYLYRCEPDGSGITSIIIDDLGSRPNDLQVVPTAGHIYWIEDHSVRRASLRGGSAEIIVGDLDEPLFVEVHEGTGDIYYGDFDFGWPLMTNVTFFVPVR